MLSLNSLAAFTQEVSRNAGIQPVRGPDRADGAARAAAPPPQRILEAVPPSGASFSAVPPRVAGFATFPVRAYARVPID